MASKFFVVLVFLSAFIFSGCEKEDSESKSKKLRISRTVVKNQGVITSTNEFEYNSIGLLSNITYRDEKGAASLISDIEYDYNNLPVKVTKYFSSSHSEYVINIEWSETGFSTYFNDKSLMDVYVLNSNNQLLTKSIICKYEGMTEYKTLSVSKYQWNGNDKMNFIADSNSDSSWEVNYAFTANPSPFKGINIAVISVVSFYISSLVECQNLYCTAGYSSINSSHDVSNPQEISTTITYDYNEYDYPTHAVVRRNNKIVIERFFEYESY